MDKATVLVILAFFGGLWLWDKWDSRYELPEDGTVVDYRAASPELRARWMETLCHGGKCLSSLAFVCGINNGPQQCVDSCFVDVTSRAVSYETLDTIRKYCGRRCALASKERGFPASNSSPENCEKRGGEWGIAPDVPVPRSK
jgi:hypothetical protein